MRIRILNFIYFVTSLLSVIVFSTVTNTTMAQNLNEAREYVLVDTAYTDATEYIINRADSLKINGHSFIGPGPVTICFYAEMKQQPSYCAWELASDTRFESIIDQFRTVEGDGRVSKLDYVFDEAGTFYVRFVADFLTNNSADENETQETISYATEIPYQIQITESLLEIPNLITPDQKESKNSVFRVRYKSLVNYEIWIHNRWGQELFHSTNPEDGWDGQFGGKTVPTGAYFYLIKAEGTDGISYNRKGSINVLRTRERNN